MKKDFCIFDIFNTTEDAFMTAFDTNFDITPVYIPEYSSKIDDIVKNQNYNICKKSEFMAHSKDELFNSTLEYLNEDFNKISMLPISLIIDWFNSEVSPSHSNNITPFVLSTQILRDSIAYKILINGDEHKVNAQWLYYNSLLYKAAFRGNNVAFKRRLSEVTTRVFDHSKKDHIGKGVDSDFTKYYEATPLMIVDEYKSLVYDVYSDLFNIVNSGKNLHDVDLSVLDSVIEYNAMYIKTLARTKSEDTKTFNAFIINQEVDTIVTSSEIEVNVDGVKTILTPKMNFLKIVDIEDKTKRYYKEIKTAEDKIMNLKGEKLELMGEIADLTSKVDSLIDDEPTKAEFKRLNDFITKLIHIDDKTSKVELKGLYLNILKGISNYNTLGRTIFIKNKKEDLYTLVKDILESSYVNKSSYKYILLFLESIKDSHRENFYNLDLNDFDTITTFKANREVLVAKRRVLSKEITALENDIQDRELFFKMKSKDGIVYADRYNVIDKRNHHSLTRLSSEFRNDLFGSYTEFDITNSLFQVIKEVLPKFKFREETSIDLTNINYYFDNRETIIDGYFDGNVDKDEYKNIKQNYLSSLGQSKAVSVPKDVDFNLNNGKSIREFNKDLKEEVKKIRSFLKCLPSFNGDITIDGHDFNIDLSMRNLLDDIQSYNRDFKFTDNNTIHYFYFQLEAQIMETMKHRYSKEYENVFRIHDAIYFM